MNNISPSFKKFFKINILKLLGFAIIYNVVATFFVIDICSISFNKIIDILGYSYLTSENFIKVLKCPYSIIFIFVLMAFILCLLVFEINVFMVTFRASYGGIKLSLYDMLYYSVLGMKHLLQYRHITTFLLLAVFFILICAFPLYHLTLMLDAPRDAITLALNHLPSNPVLYTIFTLWVVCGLSLSFTPLYICFDNTSFFKGIASSLALWKRHFFSFALRYISTNLLLILVYYFFYILLNLANIYFVKYFTDDLVTLNLILIICDNINLFLILLYSVLSPLYNIGLTVYLYYNKAVYKRQPIPTFSYEPLRRKRDYAYSAIFMIIMGFLVINISYIIHTSRDMFSALKTGVSITAHRGDSLDAPENTLPAVIHAIDNMADYVEMDVRETKDGVMVLLHDESLYRTTGDYRNIEEVNYDELCTLDAGSWFHKDYANTPIPTFEEVLIYCKDKNIKLNVELKYSKQNPTLSADVIALIKAYNMEEQCIISSTSTRILLEVKELDSDIPTGKIIYYDYINTFYDSYADFYSMRSTFITRSKVDLIHENGKEIHAWTVNSTAELSRCQRLGVDNVITDRPARARALFHQNSTPSSIYEYMKLLLSTNHF